MKVNYGNKQWARPHLQKSKYVFVLFANSFGKSIALYGINLVKTIHSMNCFLMIFNDF